MLNEERLENVEPGDEIRVRDYRLEYLTAEPIPAQHYGGAVARLALYRDDEPLGVMTPEKRMYWLEQQPASIPSVYSTLREDLYVILTAIEARRLGDLQDLPQPAGQLDLDRRYVVLCWARSRSCGRSPRGGRSRAADEAHGTLGSPLAIGAGGWRRRPAQPCAPRAARARLRGRIVREASDPRRACRSCSTRSRRGRARRRAQRPDDRGRFAFEKVSNDPGTVYLIGVRAREIPFGTRVPSPRAAELEVEVRIAAPTRTPPSARGGESPLRIDRGCERLRVTEIHELRNPTDRVLYVRAAERAGREPLFAPRSRPVAERLRPAARHLPEQARTHGATRSLLGPAAPRQQEARVRLLDPG